MNNRLHRKLPWVRDIYSRLDQARLERDELSVQLRKAEKEKTNLAAERDRWRFALSHPYPTDPFNAAWPDARASETQDEAEDDIKLVERIRAAYRLALAAAPPASESFWDNAFFALKRDVHDALIERDSANARSLLQDPRKSDLLYGFDTIGKTCRDWQVIGLTIYYDLVTLAYAIGARPLWNPESLAYSPNRMEALPDVPDLLETLDEKIGFRVTFPNPFPGEKGLSTSRGIVGLRAVQALYQAWRISTLVPKDSAVLEIGAGSGRTAFYANQFGMTDYTIVDIPMTNVAQANFLSRTLGSDKVSLYGESENRSRVRILPSSSFFGSNEKFDLIVNVDSLTEMARDTALAYCLEIKSRAKKFLSINHEYNDPTARKICATAGLAQGSRHPYWMRRGYIEELFDLA